LRHEAAEVGVDAAPAAAAARERGVEDLGLAPGGDRPLQGLEHPGGHGARTLGAGEGEGPGGLLDGAGDGVELRSEGAEAALEGGAAAQRRVVEGEPEEGALLGGQVERPERRPLDQPVAVLVPIERDLPPVECREVPVGGALRDLEMLDDLPERPRPTPAEEGDELEEPVRPGYGELR
jgi:hypothetical protein